MTYHLVKICLAARFLTSFLRMNFTNLQSIFKRNFLFKRSSWNLVIVKTYKFLKDLLGILQTLEDLLNQKFHLKIYCKSVKFILESDVKNLAAKQIFTR